MGIFRGIAFVTTKAQSIGSFHPAFVDGFISRKLELASGGNVYPIPLCILIAVTVWGSLYLSRTVTGRKLHAIGGNETAARYAGLPVAAAQGNDVRLWHGLTAGIAAMINIGYHGSAASGDGAGYELEVIAAAVVGGASLSGGRGTALGAVLGALIIRLIVDGIVILDLDQNYSQIIVGSVIVAAATLDRAQAVWRRRAPRIERRRYAARPGRFPALVPKLRFARRHGESPCAFPRKQGRRDRTFSAIG